MVSVHLATKENPAHNKEKLHFNNSKVITTSTEKSRGSMASVFDLSSVKNEIKSR